MDTIFTLGDNEDGSGNKLNLDELYERKRTHDLNTLAVYNKILGRIHNRIQVVSRQHLDVQHCWFVVPEMMIGVPSYDHGACVAYCIDQLRDNGFLLKYTHPNLLLISWQHWVPSYVRNEIKKKTGVAVDGYGNKVETIEEEAAAETSSAATSGEKKSTKFKDIQSYKPTGSLIYNENLLKNIEKKTR
jgi:hypothetical protein